MKIITHSLAALSLVALSASLMGAGHVTFRGASAAIAAAGAPGTRSAGFTEGVPQVYFIRAGVIPTSSSFGGFNGVRASAPAERLRKLDD